MNGLRLGSKPRRPSFDKCDRHMMTHSDIDDGQHVCLPARRRRARPRIGWTRRRRDGRGRDGVQSGDLLSDSVIAPVDQLHPAGGHGDWLRVRFARDRDSERFRRPDDRSSSLASVFAGSAEVTFPREAAARRSARPDRVARLSRMDTSSQPVAVACAPMQERQGLRSGAARRLDLVQSSNQRHHYIDACSRRVLDGLADDLSGLSPPGVVLERADVLHASAHAAALVLLRCARPLRHIDCRAALAQCRSSGSVRRCSSAWRFSEQRRRCPSGG